MGSLRKRDKMFEKEIINGFSNNLDTQTTQTKKKKLKIELDKGKRNGKITKLTGQVDARGK